MECVGIYFIVFQFCIQNIFTLIFQQTCFVRRTKHYSIQTFSMQLFLYRSLWAGCYKHTSLIITQYFSVRCPTPYIRFVFSISICFYGPTEQFLNCEGVLGELMWSRNS
jgi:hypothetical protein